MQYLLFPFIGQYMLLINLARLFFVDDTISTVLQCWLLNNNPHPIQTPPPPTLSNNSQQPQQHNNNTTNNNIP